MQLVVEAGRDHRRENLPTIDDVSLIIPDEYGEASFRDVVLADRNGRDFNIIPASHPRLLWPCVPYDPTNRYVSIPLGFAAPRAPPTGEHNTMGLLPLPPLPPRPAPVRAIRLRSPISAAAS